MSKNTCQSAATDHYTLLTSLKISSADLGLTWENTSSILIIIDPVFKSVAKHNDYREFR